MQAISTKLLATNARKNGGTIRTLTILLATTLAIIANPALVALSSPMPGKLPQRGKIYNHLSEEVIDSRVKELLAKADRLISSFEDEQALDLLNSALQIQPNCSEALLKRAMTLKNMDKFDQAVKVLQQLLLKDNPHYIDGLTELAGIYHQRHDYKTAKPVYSNIIEYCHKYKMHVGANIHALRADCEVSLRQPEEAVADATYAIEDATREQGLDSHDVRVGYRERARAYALLQHYEKAIADLTIAIKHTKLGFENNRYQFGQGGPMSRDSLLEERASMFDKLGKPALAHKDRDSAKLIRDNNFTDAPFRMKK